VIPPASFHVDEHKNHRHHGGHRRPVTQDIQQSTIIIVYLYVYRARLCASAAAETLFCWSNRASRRIPFLQHFHTNTKRDHGRRLRVPNPCIQQLTIMNVYRYINRRRLRGSAATESIFCWSNHTSRRIPFFTHFTSLNCLFRR